MFALIASVVIAAPHYGSYESAAPVATSTPCTAELPTAVPTVAPTDKPVYGETTALPIAVPTSTPCSEEATALPTVAPEATPEATPCSEEATALPTAGGYPTGTAADTLPVETAPAGYGQTAPILSGADSSFVSVAAIAAAMVFAL